jgi:hypothetical protein
MLPVAKTSGNCITDVIPQREKKTIVTGARNKNEAFFKNFID